MPTTAAAVPPILTTLVGRLAEAEPLLKRALMVTGKALGPEHPRVAMAANNLGMLYQAAGRHAEAEPLQRRALARPPQ